MSASTERLLRVDPGTLADLRDRYAEPRRHYHTWAHIEALMCWYDQRADALDDADAVFLAILFHDAIYDPRRSDNEDRSARLLEDAKLTGWSAESIAAAVVMTSATARHQLPTGFDGECDLAQFLDMDLSVLGSHPDVFRAYDKAIRREYAHVFLPVYWMARRRILKAFLARPTLYFSEWGREKFEAAAQANLARKAG